MLGHMKTFRVVVDNTDITDAVIGTKIYQSMVEPSWTAQIQCMDSTDLVSTLPIITGSKVKIMVETKHNVETDMKKEFEFVVYRVGDKTLQNSKNMLFTLYCATNEFATNLTQRISRNFKNTKMTDAIKQVCKDVFPNINIIGSSCDNNANLIIPNWTPYNAIGWMLKMAHTANKADFLYFQTDNNEITLESITKCFEKRASSVSLRVRPANIDLDPLNVYNIMNYNFEYSDSSANLASGYYGNTLKTFDFRTKKSDVKVYKTSEKKNWTQTFDNAENSSVTFKAKSKGVNGTANSPSDDADIWLQSRFASLLALEQIRLLAQTAGSVGTYKWLGKCINVELPNQNATDKSPTSKTEKGLYLVRAIVHSIDRQTYVNNFELVKRSFN